MKIFAIFVATTALISAIALSASANSDEPIASGFPSSERSYRPTNSNITADPCNARSCTTIGAQATYSGNSAIGGGIGISFTTNSGSPDLIRAETEREAAQNQYTNTLIKELRDAVASGDTVLKNTYAVVLAPRLGFKSPQELLENMPIRP